MWESVSRLQNTFDGVAQDIGDTMTTLTNTIRNLQRDTSGTVANVANECVESLRIITQQTERTTYLLTNGLLAMMTAMVLSIFLYLTHFSPLLRAIVWTMYASLCLHMLMTYVRHSRSRTLTIPQHGQAALQYRNQQLELTIAQSESPSKIVLTGYKLTDEDIGFVISQTINNPQCINLKLVANQITASGASILADALFNNKKLIRLSLWKNQVGDKGVQSLSNALSANESSLKQLDLSQNDITDEGAGYLAQMLKTNKVLTHLSLSNNKITDQGVQLLADALQKRNNTLEFLSLTENKSSTDASVDVLVNMFHRNRSLKKLWINDCNLSKKGRDRLKRAVRKDFELHI